MMLGVPIYKAPLLRDGDVMMSVDPPRSCIFVGTRPLTYVEATVQRMCEEILGDVLRQLGDAVPRLTSEQIFEQLKPAPSIGKPGEAP